MSLQSNAISHWLGASLESALIQHSNRPWLQSTWDCLVRGPFHQRFCHRNSHSMELTFCNQRADSRFVPSQWEMALLCNNVSHWLDTRLESALNHPSCSAEITVKFHTWHHIRNFDMIPCIRVTFKKFPSKVNYDGKIFGETGSRPGPPHNIVSWVGFTVMAKLKLIINMQFSAFHVVVMIGVVISYLVFQRWCHGQNDAKLIKRNYIIKPSLRESVERIVSTNLKLSRCHSLDIH